MSGEQYVVGSGLHRPQLTPRDAQLVQLHALSGSLVLGTGPRQRRVERVLELELVEHDSIRLPHGAADQSTIPEE